jgi:hypothetical protein
MSLLLAGATEPFCCGTCGRTASSSVELKSVGRIFALRCVLPISSKVVAHGWLYGVAQGLPLLFANAHMCRHAVMSVEVWMITVRM